MSSFLFVSFYRMIDLESIAASYSDSFYCDVTLIACVTISIGIFDNKTNKIVLIVLRTELCNLRRFGLKPIIKL